VRIGINGHLLPHGATYRAAGVASYEYELVSRLSRVAPQHDFVFFTPPGHVGAGVVPSRLPTWNPVARIAWEQAVCPVEVRSHRLDILHSPVNVAPLLLPAASVVTVHDLAFLRFPDRFGISKRLYLRTMVRASVRLSDRVIVPSEHAKTDVIAAFGLEADRVTVIAEAVRQEFQPQAGGDPPIAAPYILSVGTVEPRKNLPVLIRAFAELKRVGYPHHLALVGPRGWMFDEVYGTIATLGIEDCVSTPGFVADLPRWYNHADLFVYPSVYEGFGLPPLEAMACGTPVVVSSAGSLREVAGDAALFVEPSDVGALVQACRRVLDDRTLRSELIRAGLERAALFSWDDTARRTVEVYEAVGENRKAKMKGRRFDG
jgi:glycosyltransferase involved in cell wall biosynthesis